MVFSPLSFPSMFCIALAWVEEDVNVDAAQTQLDQENPDLLIANQAGEIQESPGKRPAAESDVTRD